MPQNIRTQSIGVFDSGFGGLSILRGIVKELPDYDFVYLGDTARVPYGTRSPEVVYEFTRQAVEFLLTKNCGLVILACNTASSDALRGIQREYLPKWFPDRNVLGVLIPAVEEAVGRTRNGRVGVLATSGTVRSGAFVREIFKLDSKMHVFQNACPMLVPLVEAGEERSPATEHFLKQYLKPLLVKKIDTLILGCTHYGMLERRIRKLVGKNVRVISEANVVARKLRGYLDRHPERERTLGRNGARTFYSTDITENFETLGKRFFGERIKVEKVNL
jgi:glutamate racemase